MKRFNTRLLKVTIRDVMGGRGMGDGKRNAIDDPEVIKQLGLDTKL